MNLSISQVCVPSKQNSNIIRCLSHPLHHHSQLCHPLPCMGFTAFQVGRHQAKFLAFESYLRDEQ